MKLPNWLRTANTRRVSVDEVRVTLKIDTTAFERSMRIASTRSRILQTVLDQGIRYQARIEYERSLAWANIALMLDDLCVRWGMEPVQVWRIPRLEEQLQRRTAAS